MQKNISYGINFNIINNLALCQIFNNDKLLRKMQRKFCIFFFATNNFIF